MTVFTFTLTLLCLGFFASSTRAAEQSRPPNIIFILADDLGWTDLTCQGSTFYETPNIDRLAREGMRFTQAYSASAVCSPTRAALLTGKYPARLHLTDWIKGHPHPRAKLKVPDWTMHLPLEERIIAEALKDAGYATASIGKWHLGGPEFYPEQHGFDVNVGGCDKGQPPSYFSPYNIPTLTDGPKGEFFSDRLTEEALSFLEQHRSKPFFIYLPHYAVHTPIMGKPEVIAKYAARANPQNPQHNATYAALVESVDDSVGRLLRRLDELKLADNTVVFFTSDNGGLIMNKVTSNLPLRSGKGSPYEGGIRVPLIVRWPGVAPAGSVCATPVITTDYYPTILQMAGLKPARRQVLDGESLVPLLKQSGVLRRDALYWHYPHYNIHPSGVPSSIVRRGDWKLIEVFDPQGVELYDLAADPGERRNLAAEQPVLVQKLRRQLENWRRKIGAQVMQPNPAFDPSQRNSKHRTP
jgi:arylsulfatase A-like enzyme